MPRPGRDENMRPLPHGYEREKSWFGWRCMWCPYGPDAVIHRVAERDREYEQHFLDAVEDYAHHLGAPDDTAFRRLVNHRTDGVGAENYGDTSFLTDQRDLLTESRDETSDTAVYCMFECEKQGYDPSEEEFIHLAVAAAHAAVADYHIRLAQQLQRVA